MLEDVIDEHHGPNDSITSVESNVPGEVVTLVPSQQVVVSNSSILEGESNTDDTSVVNVSTVSSPTIAEV